MKVSLMLPQVGVPLRVLVHCSYCEQSTVYAIAAVYPQSTLNDTPSCSSLGGTASYETYIAGQKGSRCVLYFASISFGFFVVPLIKCHFILGVPSGGGEAELLTEGAQAFPPLPPSWWLCPWLLEVQFTSWQWQQYNLQVVVCACQYIKWWDLGSEYRLKTFTK